MNSGHSSLVHPIDRHVGSRILEARQRLSMSRRDLAAHLGVSVQQMAKYEQGLTRVSSSTLYRLSRLLGTPVDGFFPQQDSADPGSGPEGDLNRFLKVYVKISNQTVRHGLLAVIRAIGKDPGQSPS